MCSTAITASPSTGLTDDELLGQATAVALTSAKGLDVGEGAGPTARKIRATGRQAECARCWRMRSGSRRCWT